jgi:hypothetical protein
MTPGVLLVLQTFHQLCLRELGDILDATHYAYVNAAPSFGN